MLLIVSVCAQVLVKGQSLVNINAQTRRRLHHYPEPEQRRSSFSKGSEALRPLTWHTHATSLGTSSYPNSFGYAGVGEVTGKGTVRETSGF